MTDTVEPPAHTPTDDTTPESWEALIADHRVDVRAVRYDVDRLERLSDGHPDENACPPWCEYVTDNEEGYSHEIRPEDPMRAQHTLGYDHRPETVATLYDGWAENGSMVRPAVVQIGARALSDRPPMVLVNLRYGDESARAPQTSERLRLTVADARELIVALTYVCDLVEADESGPGVSPAQRRGRPTHDNPA